MELLPGVTKEDYLNIDTVAGTVAYADNLVDEMRNAQENHILICEIQSCI